MIVISNSFYKNGVNITVVNKGETNNPTFEILNEGKIAKVKAITEYSWYGKAYYSR